MKINIQIITKEKNIPTSAQFKRWVKAALPDKESEVNIRIVDKQEIIDLNQQYRHKKGPTNVLAFPFEAPVPTPFLGDIIICAQIANQETKQQHKPKTAHWAHLTIHGVLHLLGYDHDNAKDAKKMENLEIKLLATLGFPNPYH
jgi:probable rRNA maturation factor